MFPLELMTSWFPNATGKSWCRWKFDRNIFTSVYCMQQNFQWHRLTQVQHLDGIAPNSLSWESESFYLPLPCMYIKCFSWKTHSMQFTSGVTAKASIFCTLKREKTICTDCLQAVLFIWKFCMFSYTLKKY